MRNWSPPLWRVIYVAGGAVVLFGSFFITLWLTEPDVPKAVDNRSDTERLAAQHVSTYPELENAAANAELRFSRQLQGVVDGVNRVNEHEVNMGGGLPIAREMRRRCTFLCSFWGRWLRLRKRTASVPM